MLLSECNKCSGCFSSDFCCVNILSSVMALCYFDLSVKLPLVN